ncbi:MAG: PmbA/TldA family metallopeptidase, partial [Planctomycetota bacterium]
MLDRIDTVLKKFSDQCDYLEARIEERESTGIVLRGKEVDTIQEAMGLGGCVRAYVKGGVGFTSFNNVDRMAEFAEKAVAQAKMVGSGKTVLADAPVLTAERPAEILNDPRKVP